MYVIGEYVANSYASALAAYMPYLGGVDGLDLHGAKGRSVDQIEQIERQAPCKQATIFDKFSPPT